MTMKQSSFLSHDLSCPRGVTIPNRHHRVQIPFLNPESMRRHHRAYLAAEISQTRLLIGAVIFFCGFLIMGVRLAELTLWPQHQKSHPVSSVSSLSPVSSLSTVSPPLSEPKRANITDRKGVLLATSLPVDSLYADPRKLMDIEAAIDGIRQIFPQLSAPSLRKKLNHPGRFVWIKRGLTPRQTDAINQVGIPGLYFRREERRIYPQGRLTSHITGFTDIDQSGLAGIERGLENRLTHHHEPLVLSLDIRLQHALRQELLTTMETHSAQGAAGLILDIHNGEILALASLPDFDPNIRDSMTPETLFNRATLGVYEMGSTLKPFTLAMALDAGIATLDDVYDVQEPIEVSQFTIQDYESMDRPLSLPEVLIHSSNIGAAKIALDVGGTRQQAFLDQAGLLTRTELEIAEIGNPIIPDPWRDINVMTVGFGHGLAVNMLQLACGIAALTNGGHIHKPTLVKRNPQKPVDTHPLISPETSDIMRDLLRSVVKQGTARKSDIPGYDVAGKTGTAEKAYAEGYQNQAVVSSFVGVFPAWKPRYLVLTLFDEPEGTSETFNRATGGWIAAPTAGRIIARIGPMLGIQPLTDEEKTSPSPDPTLTPQETILAAF